MFLSKKQEILIIGKNVIWLLCSPDTHANYFYSLKINLVIVSRKITSHFKTETLPWWSYDLNPCLHVSAITFIKQTVLHVSLVTLRSSCCNSIQTRILSSWCNASPMQVLRLVSWNIMGKRLLWDISRLYENRQELWHVLYGLRKIFARNSIQT